MRTVSALGMLNRTQLAQMGLVEATPAAWQMRRLPSAPSQCTQGKPREGLGKKDRGERGNILICLATPGVLLGCRNISGTLDL